MRKIRIVVILALFVVGIMGTFFAVAYLWPIQLGEPKLKVEFDPSPPWHVESGRNLTLTMMISNNAWLFATVEHVQIIVLAPIDFIVYGAGTNEYNLYFDMLRGGEGQNNTLTLTVPRLISSGNYSITVGVSAENVPEQNLTAQVMVEQPIWIP